MYTSNIYSHDHVGSHWHHNAATSSPHWYSPSYLPGITVCGHPEEVITAYIISFIYIHAGFWGKTF